MNEVYFYTPFFIDAKISSGKISKDTLSVNRILLGTEFSIRLRSKDTSAGNLNKYIFTFRGINASDRDFKRVEGKFNFEFRPLFDKLNEPINLEPYKPSSILLPEKEKTVTKDWFGYQIQPFIGFEIGRIYRVKRDAFANEENSRNLRRLIFGIDISLNLTKYATITLSDTFYIRGESKDSRNRNYFKGEFEAPILSGGNTSQSIFFSFERGDVPPFATPGVNAIKAGYRITSNIFKRIP